MPHLGHRDNPIAVAAPGDLDRATGRAWDPSPEQAAAGNYKKTHARIGSLDVTIETPKGRNRSGTSPDGHAWSVTMPCHYGYFKRTLGSDGDHVDAYFGEHTHRAHELPVYIIDQVDAETGAYDEAKCMVGFATPKEAGDAYLAAFSDGRGRERTGAVTRMPFSTFCSWLVVGDTTKPLGHVPTAKAIVFSPSGCGCGGINTACQCHSGGSGEIMTTEQTESTPRGMGYLTKALGTILGRMTSAERTDLMKDAGLAASLELGKAANLLEESGIEHVEDIFDGPQDDEVRTTRAQGPESSVAAGTVNTGSTQESSGAGAARMEREYSRHAPAQSGVQRATEALGRKIASHGKAMKGFIAFGKAMQDRLAILENTTALSSPAALDHAVLDAAVAKALPGAVAIALAKALPDLIRTVSKAKAAAEPESKEEGEEDDDDEDDGKENPFGKAEEDGEREEEGEEEGEDEAKKAAAKAAAQERLTAKSLLRAAKQASNEAVDSLNDGRAHAGARAFGKAQRQVSKARMHLAVAKSLRDGKVGPSTKAIEKSIEALDKAMKETKAKNQDKWPASEKSEQAAATTVTATATGAGTGTAATAPNAELLAKAIAAVEAANAGSALLTANVQQLMTLVSGQSREGGAGGPPVNALFKANPDLAGNKEAQINALVNSGALTMVERDKAIDALSTLKMPGLPAGMVEAAISTCAEPAQAILRAA